MANDKDIKFVEVRPGMLTERESIRIVVRVPAAMEDPFYNLCGRDGVITSNFIEGAADKTRFSTVPLEGCNRLKALELAGFHGAECYGVTPNRLGYWGIRLLTTRYDAMAKKIRPDDSRGVQRRIAPRQ